MKTGNRSQYEFDLLVKPGYFITSSADEMRKKNLKKFFLTSEAKHADFLGFPFVSSFLFFSVFTFWLTSPGKT